MKVKTQLCQQCKNFTDYYQWLDTGKHCVIGHKPRFYKGVSPYDWNWKRKCEDFKSKEKINTN